MHTHVFVVWVCARLRADTSRVQKKVSDSLEPELQAFVSHATWLLGTKFSLVLQEALSTTPRGFCLLA